MSKKRGRFAELTLILYEAWNLALLVGRNAQPLLVLAIVALIAWALFSRQPWPFSVEADAEHATLVLARDLETHWRVDGALLCVRANSGTPPLPALGSGISPCPSRRWRAYDLRDLDEVALRIPANPRAESGAVVHLDVEPDGALAIQISGPEDEGLDVQILVAEGEPLSVGRELLLHFPVPAAGEPLRRILLPFSGAGSIGKDVSWREPALLRSGVVSLYTRSDESAGGRDLVASTQLLPGDRIDLGESGSQRTGMTKGFVHFDLLPGISAPPALRVVAFGEADAVRIVRYGEQGYSFSPGLLVRITRHRAVSTWVVLIFSALGLMAVYREGSEIGSGSLQDRRHHLRDRWREYWHRNRERENEASEENARSREDDRQP